MNESLSRKNVVRLVAFAFLALSIWYLGSTFFNLADKTAVLDIILENIGLIFLCSLLYFSGSLLNAYGFSILFPEWKPQRKQIVLIYLRTMIGKYLPGNVGHFLGRHFFLKHLGLNHKNLIHSHASDLGSSVLGVTVLLIPFFAFSSIFDPLAPWFGNPAVKYSVVTIVVTLLVLSPIVIGKILPKYGHLADPILRGIVPYAVAILIFSLSYAAWTTFSLTANTNFDSATVMIFAYLCAWLLGFITVGAPGGIGVREATLVFLLGPQYGDDHILALAFGHRVIAVIGEMIGFVGASLLIRRKAPK